MVWCHWEKHLSMIPEAQTMHPRELSIKPMVWGYEPTADKSVAQLHHHPSLHGLFKATWAGYIILECWKVLPAESHKKLSSGFTDVITRGFECGASDHHHPHVPSHLTVFRTTLQVQCRCWSRCHPSVILGVMQVLCRCCLSVMYVLCSGVIPVWSWCYTGVHHMLSEVLPKELFNLLGVVRCCSVILVSPKCWSCVRYHQVVFGCCASVRCVIRLVGVVQVLVGCCLSVSSVSLKVLLAC